jgi:hypothetical protein
MALIEIDGLPGFTVLKTGDFPWQLLNNQMVVPKKNAGEI